MANSIATQELAILIAGTVKEKLPVAKYCNQELSSLLSEDSGSRVDYLAPEFGSVNVGAAVPDGAADIRRDKVSVDLIQYNTTKSYNALEKAIQIGNFRRAIAQPIAVGLASQLNTRIALTAMSAAQSSIIGVNSFADLANAIAYCEQSRVGDSINGVLSPLSMTSIINSGANKFANERLTDDLYYEGYIGEFMGSEFARSQDMPAIGYGTLTSASVNAFTATVDLTSANANGKSTLGLSSITAGDGTTTINFLYAGTPISIDGYNTCDLFGNDMGLARIFVIGPNLANWGGAAKNNPAHPAYAYRGTPDFSWLVTNGSATVSIATIKLAGQVNPLAGQNGNPSMGSAGALWAVPNTVISGTVAPSTTGTCKLISGIKYSTGVVFAEKAVMLAGRQAAPIGYDNAVSGLDGELNITMSRHSDGKLGLEYFRFDTLMGVSPAYTQGASVIYNALQVI